MFPLQSTDQILIMRDGDIVECGNHQELFVLNKFYTPGQQSIRSGLKERPGSSGSSLTALRLSTKLENSGKIGDWIWPTLIR